MPDFNELIKDKELLNVASNDPNFNSYDLAAIQRELLVVKAIVVKEMFITVTGPLLSLLAGIAIALSNNVEKSYLIAAVASPTSVATLIRKGNLESYVSDRK